MISSVFAADVSLDSIYAPGQALGGNNATLGNLVSPLINDVLIGSGLLAFGVILMAGFSYISASGDKGKIEQAQNMLNYGILGLAVVALAFLVTRIIGAIFGFKFF